VNWQPRQRANNVLPLSSTLLFSPLPLSQMKLLQDGNGNASHNVEARDEERGRESEREKRKAAA